MAAFPTTPALWFRFLVRAEQMLSKLQMKRLVGTGLSLVVSERIIENPLVLLSLREHDVRVLDFGGFESVLPLQLASLGYQVTVLDQRPYPFRHSNLTVRHNDVFEPYLRIDDPFDVVVSVSTIEHLGLGAYGDSFRAEDADARGVEVLWSLVKPGGRLVASVPAGRRAVFRDFRVYDSESLKRVFPNATQVRRFMKGGREGIWREVEAATTDGLAYSDPTAPFPVEAIAFVISDKIA